MKNKLVILLGLCLTIPFFRIFGQENTGNKYSVNGKLLNDKNEAVADELVLLFRSSDSLLLKTALTDGAGSFNFEEIGADTLFLAVKSSQYELYSGESFVLNSNLHLSEISLKPKSQELGEVEVVKKKAYIEREAGKYILNIENSIQATGSSAFEVIEKAPGVIISANDVIRLQGKQGILVQINGKNLPMTGTDLANYLRGISSASIEKIEFITNPSAKNDAAGSSIINIKLKKETRFGTNGNVSLTYGQGVYPKTSEGFSLNHRTKKFNLYGSYNFVYRKAFNNLKLDRKFYTNDTFQGAYIQENYLVFPFKNHLGRIGIDFTPDDKNSFSLVLNGVSNRFNPTGKNVSLVEDEQHLVASRFETTNNSFDHWYNFSSNLNYRHSMDTLGSEITVDVDYAHYGNKTEQNFETNFYDLNNNPMQKPYLLYGDLRGSLSIYSLKSDVLKVFKNKNSLEYGVKSSYVIADNSLNFYDRSMGSSIYDSTKSNHFIYKENINAGYLSFRQEFKKFSFVYGVRVEQTNISGNQLVYHVVNDTSYLQLFPTLSMHYKMSEKHGFDLNFNRRIDRPGYDQLNPFKFYLDPSTYRAGNPYLGPQSTYSTELGYSWKEKIYASLGIARTVNNIVEIIAPVAGLKNVTAQTNTNLASTDIYYFNLSVPFEVKKWWVSNTDLNSYVALYSGNVANTSLNKRGTYSFNVTTVNTFLLGKTTSLELSGHYRFKEVYAFDSIHQIWYIGFGVQQKILKNSGTLKLSVTDICFSNKTTADVTFRDYREHFVVSRETRVATLAFTYRFGNKQVQAAKRRAGGADDLKQRVKSLGGA